MDLSRKLLKFNNKFLHFHRQKCDVNVRWHKQMENVRQVHECMIDRQVILRASEMSLQLAHRAPATRYSKPYYVKERVAQKWRICCEINIYAVKSRHRSCIRYVTPHVVSPLLFMPGCKFFGTRDRQSHSQKWKTQFVPTRK